MVPTTLSFGAPAAERDIRIGLLDYFVDSETYRRFNSRQKTVLLGNRGSGKSAVFKVLAERQRASGFLVLELSPEDYSYEMLQQSLTSESQGSWAKHGAFTAAWKYLILIMVMKALNESGPGLRTGSARAIYEYLRDNHRGEQGNPIALLISYLKRIEGFKIGRWEASVKTQELERLYKLEELQGLIRPLVEVCRRRPISVFVDELDRGWDATEDAQAFVSGLVQASISLNDNSPNLTVFVSLRRELYESIPALYDDAQKYRDIIETVAWDEPQLLALIANRIRHSVPALHSLSDLDAWNSVFAEVLEYRNAKSFNYMIDRSLYRPREIIQFCTDALDEARRSPTEKLNYPVISRSELTYSESRTKDIAAEFRFQYPGLLSVFEIFRGRNYLLSSEELQYLCLQIVCGELAAAPEAEWVHRVDQDQLVDVLWRVGFLRAYAVGGLKALRRSGSSYLGPHQVTSLNLRSIGRFQVHPMFRTFLGLKEAKSTREDEEE